MKLEIKTIEKVFQALRGITAAAALLFLGLGNSLPAFAQSGRFDGYEIRVIRPKFMTKRNRLELGAQGLLIMNQSFIYTFMAAGLLDYHFSEMFALEINGAYGFSIDKEDKRILDDEFDIKTQILRTQYLASAGLLWTPIYGKTQLTNGQVLYFDSFLTFAAGMTGVQYNYEQCVVPPGDVAGAGSVQKPAPATKSYPTGIIGVGQKYFISQDWGFRWDVRDNVFMYEQGDGSCTPDVAIGTKMHHNVTLQVGASTFF